MSRQLALNAVHLRPNPRPAHTEYSVMNYHHELLARVIPNYSRSREDLRQFLHLWDVDFLFNTDDCIAWAKLGRTTDMGHADYAADGSDRREPKTCPFTDVEEVYAFDPAREYGLQTHAELVSYYRNSFTARQDFFRDQLCTGGYYKTVISGCIQAFGWDMLLLAAADPERFAEVLRRFGRYTLHYVRAQAESPCEVFIQHDDFVWTSGPFMSPAIYRDVIIPLYAEMWRVLHQAGKKVLFCSDGTYTMFMPDLARAGADGFIFEPSNDFAWVVGQYGRTHCLVGSAVDCRTMTFGTWEQVRAEVDATLALSRQCAGHIWSVGNHMPPNIPADICQQYIDYLKQHWSTTAR